MPCFGGDVYVDLSAVHRKFERLLRAKGCTEQKARAVAMRWVRNGKR